MDIMGSQGEAGLQGGGGGSREKVESQGKQVLQGGHWEEVESHGSCVTGRLS